MNYLDIIIAAPVLYALIKGFLNGLIKEITSLISLIFGVYFGINFSEYLAPKITNTLNIQEEFGGVLAFAVLFFVTILCIKGIGYMLDKATRILALGIISKILGGIFGAIKVVVVFSFLLFVTSEYDLINNKTKKESVLFEPLSQAAEIIIPKIKDHQNVLDKIDEKTKKVKLKINSKTNSQ